VLFALAALVAAVAPVGFHSSPRVAPAASVVAQKPVTVWCADSAYTWNQFLDATYGNHNPARGSTAPGSSEEQLSPGVCTALAKAAASKLRVVPTATLGVSILTLVHESIHARGERDEGVTDCAASHEMPRVAVKFFHVRAGKDLRTLMRLVANYRETSAQQLRTVC
jgi:hypothetical protein